MTAYPDVADVPETEVTFEGNSLLKARASRLRPACRPSPTIPASLSRCSVDAPASSRRAGPGRAPADAARADKDRANLTLLLEQVADVPDEHRGAAFVCAAVVALPDGRYAAAEGRVSGHLERIARGQNGFGYDPIFVPAEQESGPVLHPGGVHRRGEECDLASGPRLPCPGPVLKDLLT